MKTFVITGNVDQYKDFLFEYNENRYDYDYVYFHDIRQLQGLSYFDVALGASWWLKMDLLNAIAEFIINK